ncbi:hypothetical protein C7999DRAFT_17534 [Corynascus novoguineensis]|uniref:BHLH domain-containing protein n=1 Tax=Corynascus novoguineensis TaxID=1126955 RepID=A0AAN7CNY7_9PEZI|nr:hypothetical protein C7999DRAFT_17534 [Corynascus novoguineensis]
MTAGQVTVRGRRTKTRSPPRTTPGPQPAASRRSAIMPAAKAADSDGSVGSPARNDDMHAHSPQLQHVRRRQNRVGKRYRDKLTAGFESLQATLGAEDAGTPRDAFEGVKQQDTAADGQGRRSRTQRRSLNKAKVLDLTCERVKALLQEWESLKAAQEAMQKEREVERW